MKKNKVYQYLISGLILFYFAITDDKFEVIYNGIALIAGIIAFSLAFIEYKKSRTE